MSDSEKDHPVGNLGGSEIQMGYRRRFLGGPLGGVEDWVEADEIGESVEATEGAIYRRDEILEGGGDMIVYRLDEVTWPPSA